MLETHATAFHHDAVVPSHTAPVVVMFHASWCGPCKGMKPVIEALALELGFALVGVDAGADRALAASWGVRAVPTLLVLKNGLADAKLAGGQTPDQLRSWLAAAGVP